MDETFRKLILKHQDIAIKAYNRPDVIPDKKDLFNCFKHFNFFDTKVVMVFLSPYPNPRYATGIATGIPKDMNMPPTLKKINEAIQEYTNKDEDIDKTMLTWVNQGILMLNAALTLQKGKSANSDVKLWEPFIIDLIKEYNKITGIIFCFYGTEAASYAKYVNEFNHYIFVEKHPAYYSYKNIPFIYDSFSFIDDILFKNNKEKITWL